MANKKRVLAVLFDGMLYLDFNGPQTAMFMTQDPLDYNKSYYDVVTIALGSKKTSIVTSENMQIVADYTFQNLPQTRYDILVIPGGQGTRKLVDNTDFLAQLKLLCGQSDLVFTICTGSALLAKAGLLDNKEATTNTIAWAWATAQGPKVKWIPGKRWVDSAPFLTSAGVSAGIDAGLYLISKQYGRDAAITATTRMEYHWNENPDATV